jgi:uncharacterized damage-inducible protein DinB
MACAGTEECRREKKAGSTRHLRFCRTPLGKVRFAGRADQAPANMNKDDIQLLYEYDRWANNRVLQAASALSAELFTRDLGGGFRSVRDTLVHIIAGEWGWLAYWKEPTHGAAFLADLRKRREALFHPEAFPNAAAVRAKWAEVEKEQAEFVNGVTNESLGRMLPFRTTQASLAHLMQHLANHSTYHRGQVALMMRQLDGEPLATDFHVFLVEGRHEAGAVQ